MSRPPLEGIRVLDLSRLLPGPLLTGLMARMGADVVRVEAPEGGDWSRFAPPMVEVAPGREAGASFVALNQGKRSLALDLKQPAARDALLRLVDGADVLVESFRPGALARLGLAPEALRARNPRLIVCSISGYGQDGPWRDRAGHDLNYLALSGLLAAGGASWGGEGPALPGGQIADIAGGSLFGLSAVLGALLGRERHGEGAHLDVSMTEGAAVVALMQLVPALVDGQAGAPGLLTGEVPCYNVYTCRDGRHIALGALEPKFWAALVARLERPDLLDKALCTGDEGRAVRAELQRLFGARDRDAWVAHFEGVDCCLEPVLAPHEVAAHPLHRARGLFRTGAGLQVRTALDRGHAVALGPPPLPGEHTRATLREAGIGDGEIEALLAAGAAVALGLEEAAIRGAGDVMHEKVERVGVLFGGRSGEHEVSLVSARTVARGLREAGFEVVPIAIDKRGAFWVQPDGAQLDAEPPALHPAGRPLALRLSAPGAFVDAASGEALRLDAIFPVLHGSYGEDGTVQGLLEMAEVPYVGNGVLASSACMDKDVTKRLLRDAGVPVVPWLTLRGAARGVVDPGRVAARVEAELGGWPVFVKPANAGSSVGINKVRRADQLEAALRAAGAYDDKVLVEAAVDAREIEISVLGDPLAGDAPRASVCGEIVPNAEFYTYAAKYLDPNGADLLAPAPIDEETAARVGELALQAFEALELAGLARIDFFLDRGTGALYLNEVNTLPGFTAISMYPRLWALSGVPLPELVRHLVEIGVARHRLRAGLRTERDL